MKNKNIILKPQDIKYKKTTINVSLDFLNEDVIGPHRLEHWDYVSVKKGNTLHRIDIKKANLNFEIYNSSLKLLMREIFYLFNLDSIEYKDFKIQKVN